MNTTVRESSALTFSGLAFVFESKALTIDVDDCRVMQDAIEASPHNYFYVWQRRALRDNSPELFGQDMLDGQKNASWTRRAAKIDLISQRKWKPLWARSGALSKTLDSNAKVRYFPAIVYRALR